VIALAVAFPPDSLDDAARILGAFKARKALANHRESLAKARAARKRPSDREIRA
jgi:hypothetical protein